MSNITVPKDPATTTTTRPVLATLSLVIATAIALTWLISLIAVWRGASPAGAGMAFLLTIPAGGLGAGIAILALMFRGENKRIVQYGLWLNGLLGFFAYPLMMTVLLGM